MAHRRASKDNVSFTGLPSSYLLFDAPFDMHSFDKTFAVCSVKVLSYISPINQESQYVF